MARPAAEPLIVAVVLNQEPKGEFVVYMTLEGDFLVRVEDLEAWGVRLPPGPAMEIDGQAYRSLRSISGVTFEFDERTLTLHVAVPPTLLEDVRPGPYRLSFEHRGRTCIMDVVIPKSSEIIVDLGDVVCEVR